jgi:Chromosome segregation ATPases
MSISPELYELIIKIVDERVKEIKVTREEYDKLKRSVDRLSRAVQNLINAQKRTEEIVKELALAQKRSEEELIKVENAIAELTEVQKRSEERLSKLEDKVGKLEDRTSKLEDKTAKLEEAIITLTEVQKRSEERLSKLEDRTAKLEDRTSKLEEAVLALIEAQKKFEERITRLEEAMQQLIITVEKLSKNIIELNKQVSALGENYGFALEDIGRAVLPSWIYQNLGIKVESIERRFFYIDNEEIEVNLYAEGMKGEEKVVIIIEVKSRIYQSDVEKFYAEKFVKVSKLLNMKTLGILFGFFIHPKAHEIAKNYGFNLITAYGGKY